MNNIGSNVSYIVFFCVFAAKSAEQWGDFVV